MPIQSESAAAGPRATERDVALCRSAVWEALALGFRPPTGETLERLAAAEGARALAAAACVLDRTDHTDLAGRVMALAVEPVPAATELTEAYGRLFGHTARGQVPPYETEYGEDSLFEPPRQMSDLVAFFRAFGLALRPGARERPDHIACELEFLLVLARKEAHALEVADADMLASTRSAGRAFLRDHLGRWAPGFGAKLAREDPRGFYGALGGLTAAAVTGECRRLDVPAGPDLLRLRSAELGGAPMACGPAATGSLP
jgi:DMSO reductase family type II enzyme chaperone